MSTAGECVTASDGRLEELCGIRRRHAAMLLAFCQIGYRGRQLLIIVRKANPASLDLHGKPGHEPKPYGVDDKTRPSGRVKPKEQKDASGRVIPPEERPFYYSDYDLQGVYELRHTGDYVRLHVGNYVPGEIGTKESVDSAANPFLDALNQYVCRRFGDPDLFQHGTQDDYRAAGRPVKPIKDDCFAAFEHTGAIHLIPDLEALRTYYQSRPGMTWIY